jgi:hypothetical protein
LSGFRVGTFDRGRLRGFVRQICPSRAVASVVDVSPAGLKSLGKKLVLLDVDNTLMPWHGEAIPESSKRWIADIKNEGMIACILSNTHRVDRLERIAGALGVDFIRGRFKPNPKMYRQALERYAARPEQAVMIGDQLFTDVWGANRAGIEAVWVQPLASREFAGTKISRLGERLFRNALYGALKPREEKPNDG